MNGGSNMLRRPTDGGVVRCPESWGYPQILHMFIRVSILFHSAIWVHVPNSLKPRDGTFRKKHMGKKWAGSLVD